MPLDTGLLTGFRTVAAAIKADRAALATKASLPQRSATFPLGGCEGADGDWGGATTMTEKVRVHLPVKVDDMRIHVRNWNTQADSAATTTPLTGLTASIGPIVGQVGFNLSAAPQVFGSGNGASPVGQTEWISDWLTPSFDATKPSLLSVQWSMPSGTPLAYGNAMHALLLNAAAVSTQSVGTPQTSGPSTTAWFDGQFGVLEVWIEYRYKGLNGQGMVIGHSLPDGCNYNNTSMPGWDGINTSWVNQAARKNNQAIVQNCCANTSVAASGAWSSTSKKWSRFMDQTFDWIIVELAGNDILAVTTATQTAAQLAATAATLDTNLRAVIAKARSLWPSADIYVPTAMPIKPNDTTTNRETVRVAFNTALNKLLGDGVIQGILDFERAIASGSDYSTLDLRTQDSGAPSTRHASPYGHGLLAAAVNIG